MFIYVTVNYLYKCKFMKFVKLDHKYFIHFYLQLIYTTPDNTTKSPHKRLQFTVNQQHKPLPLNQQVSKIFLNGNWCGTHQVKTFFLDTLHESANDLFPLN